MRILIFGGLISLLSFVGTADVTAQSPIIAEVENVDSGPRGRTTRMEILSDGRHLRVNQTNGRGQRTSMIRGSAPETLMVSHDRRMVIRIPAPSASPPRVPTSAGDESGSSPRSEACRYRSWRPTGNTATIGGFAARELQVLDGTRVCATFWTSSAAPFGLFEVYERIGAVMTAVPGGPSPLTPMFARARALSRFPSDPVVRMSTEGSTKVTTLLRAARSPTPAASEFEAPPGYAVRSMPALGSGGMPPGMMPRVRVPSGKRSRATWN